MAHDVFTRIAGQFDQAVSTGVTSVVSNAISANATLLGSLLTIYVIVFGMLMMFRQIDRHAFFVTVFRAGMISTLLSASAFSSYVQDPAMNTIPAWIASSVTGNAVATGPAQFDLIWSAILHFSASIFAQATGVENIGAYIECATMTWLIGLLLGIAFVIFEFARGMMGLLVCVVPFVLGLYLFAATRAIPERLVGKMVGLLVVQLLLSIMLQIMIAGDRSFVLQAAAAGEGLPEALASFAEIFIFFFFGVAMVVMIPAYAASIGGGVALRVGSLTSVPMNAIRNVSIPRGRALQPQRASP